MSGQDGRSTGGDALQEAGGQTGQGILLKIPVLMLC